MAHAYKHGGSRRVVVQDLYVSMESHRSLEMNDAVSIKYEVSLTSDKHPMGLGEKVAGGTVNKFVPCFVALSLSCHHPTLLSLLCG